MDSTEYQWCLTAQLGRKLDSNNALYASKVVTLPSLSSSTPLGVTSQRRVSADPEKITSASCGTLSPGLKGLPGHYPLPKGIGGRVDSSLKVA